MTANATEEVRDMRRVKIENHRKRVRAREREGCKCQTEIDI